jgi:hypothetical protein
MKQRLWEIILTAILSLAFYAGAVFFIFGKEYDLPWRLVSSRTAIIVVLAMNAAWMVLIRVLPSKSFRIKMIVTFVLITLSSVAITDLYLIYSWSRMW